ncbi:unnamed protein product [Cuscuta epithymum]|uniref:RNase H type-1 domain-containing protein n=1 Tax=Cuscuta epithymum TaxID=186058 RepID=A0AAV0E897_9ASTE|nr:unnamed protein product [Cuscuta epithymum]
MMHWWLKAGSKTLLDLLKHLIPGIICWFIWKTYAEFIWGDRVGGVSSESIIIQIKHFISTWITSLSRLKIPGVEDVLLEEGIIPRNFKVSRMKIRAIRWIKPQNCLKLNTDACYVPGKAGGAAILRNDDGKLIAAIAFPLVASSSLEAEIFSIAYASRWMVDAGFHGFHVETDCMLALGYLTQVRDGRWKGCFQEMELLRIRKAISFGHIWREANTAAHYLAKSSTNILQQFYRAKDLPIQITLARGLQLEKTSKAVNVLYIEAALSQLLRMGSLRIASFGKLVGCLLILISANFTLISYGPE